MNKNFYTGIIRQEKSNNILCDIPEFKEPIIVPMKFLNKTMSGDKVLIKVKENKWGFVQKLIERPNRILTGKIQINDNHAFIKPWTSDLFKDFFVDKKDLGDSKNGDVVEFKIKEWNKNQKSPKAIVLKTLYNTNQEQYLLYRLNLPNKFPDSVIDELKDINISKSEIDSRIDFRNLNIFSIDPETCTDIDDALSFEKTVFGYRIGIHIADVSHFIKAGSELDKEAYNRAFTIYFPKFSIPMIPQKLSSDLCSLMEGVDRLCVSVIINIDNDLNIIDSNIVRSVINNKKKFSYEEAEEHKNNPESEYYTILNSLFTIGAKIRKNWFPNEMILNKKEIKWELDDESNPIKILFKNKLSTMELIQSWMLICNKLITIKAESLSNNIPWIYRVHEGIENENLDLLKSELVNIGMIWDDKISNTQNIKKFLNEKSDIFSDILIKKFLPAKYSQNKTGHFSLGVSDYSHFTSPIRRYSDIITHRILLNLITEKPVYCANIHKDCEWITNQERKIQKVENYYNSLLSLKFVKNINYALNGTIIQINQNRAIIKTELNIEATLELKDNDMLYENNILIFKNHNYKIGDVINVNISKLDNDKNIIYLKINF